MPDLKGVKKYKINKQSGINKLSVVGKFFSQKKKKMHVAFHLLLGVDEYWPIWMQAEL